MADNFDDMSMAADLYTLVDEEGVEQQFEMLDTMVVLKSEYDENNDETLVSIDNDEEYEKIGNMFLERLNEIYDS